jgi:prolyl-tRNA synthetase
MKKAEELYRGREEEVLFDDRDLRPGEKFTDAELMGIPYRVVVSDKTLADGKAEVTDRKTGETKLVTLTEIF